MIGHMTDPTNLTRLAAPKAPPFAIPTWLRPIPVPAGAHSLAGGRASFDLVDIVQRDETGYSVSRATADTILAAADDHSLAAATLDRLTAPRPALAGLQLDHPVIMGILNVTPDSFSDGGRHNAPARAVAAGRAMIEAGAGNVLSVMNRRTAKGVVGQTMGTPADIESVAELLEEF